MRRFLRNFAAKMARIFKFKQFSMTDEHCGMRIGTDGVLLGAWAGVCAATSRIADIGAGCGIISLMLAQRTPQAIVDAVECDAGAAGDAEINFAASPWQHRLHLHQCSFADFRPQAAYDLVVSNPPFFTETLRSPDSTRAVARHAGELCFDALAARCAGGLLAAGGRLAVILPSTDDDATLLSAAMNRLYPRRHYLVQNSNGAKPKRSLWEFASDDGPCETANLTIRNADGSFTEGYCALTHEFHIHIQ